MSRIIVDTMSNIDVNELNRLGAFKRPTAFPFMGCERLSTSLNTGDQIGRQIGHRNKSESNGHDVNMVAEGHGSPVSAEGASASSIMATAS